MRNRGGRGLVICDASRRVLCTTGTSDGRPHNTTNGNRQIDNGHAERLNEYGTKIKGSKIA